MANELAIISVNAAVADDQHVAWTSLNSNVELLTPNQHTLNASDDQLNRRHTLHSTSRDSTTANCERR